jgi:multidrug transporter EmrE-like cation transporter
MATFLSLSPSNRIVEFLVRGTFFLLNLAFNAAMWALFTAALTRADSTTRVSIVNVSANFVITAMLGWMVFGEKLSGLWFLGAGLLAVGNVVIGRREEGKKPGGSGSMGLDESVGEAELRGEEEGEEAEGLLGRGGGGARGRGRGRGRGRAEEVELDESEGGLLRRRSSEEDGRDRERVKRGVEVDDPI